VLDAIYRPYLEFMYPTTPITFYSPEPGPPRTCGSACTTTDADDKQQGEWCKVPRLDDKGDHGHAASMIYQRYLSLTEHTIYQEPVVAGAGRLREDRGKTLGLVAGRGPKRMRSSAKAPAKHELWCRCTRLYSKSQQYHPAQENVRRVLESYTPPRAAASRRRRIRTGGTRPCGSIALSIRFRPHSQFMDGAEATDPMYYTPIYMGEYDATGKLLDPEDPLLYWHLPILRDGALPARVADPRLGPGAGRGDEYWTRVLLTRAFGCGSTTG